MTFPVNEAPEWVTVVVGLAILASPLIIAAFAAGVAWGRRGWTKATQRHVTVWSGDEKDAVISYLGSAATVERAPRKNKP